MIWKVFGSGRGLFKAPYHMLPGVTEENHAVLRTENPTRNLTHASSVLTTIP